MIIFSLCILLAPYFHGLSGNDGLVHLNELDQCGTLLIERQEDAGSVFQISQAAALPFLQRAPGLIYSTSAAALVGLFATSAIQLNLFMQVRNTCLCLSSNTAALKTPCSVRTLLLNQNAEGLIQDICCNCNTFT